ncbi:unnamed protein product [Victoria cruziana]
MRREEVALGSVADLTFRFRHNKACTVFLHLGAQRAVGNDSTTVPQIRKLILSNRCCSLDSRGTVRIGELLQFFLNSLDSPVENHLESLTRTLPTEYNKAYKMTSYYHFFIID